MNQLFEGWSGWHTIAAAAVLGLFLVGMTFSAAAEDALKALSRYLDKLTRESTPKE